MSCKKVVLEKVEKRVGKATEARRKYLGESCGKEFVDHLARVGSAISAEHVRLRRASSVVSYFTLESLPLLITPEHGASSHPDRPILSRTARKKMRANMFAQPISRHASCCSCVLERAALICTSPRRIISGPRRQN